MHIMSTDLRLRSSLQVMEAFDRTPNKDYICGTNHSDAFLSFAQLATNVSSSCPGYAKASSFVSSDTTDTHSVFLDIVGSKM